MRLKCSDFAPNDPVACKACGDINQAKDMPQTATGFRFECKPCHHKRSLRGYHSRRTKRAVPFSESVNAVKSVLFRPETVKSTNVNQLNACSDGTLLVLSPERCLCERDWDKPHKGTLSQRGYMAVMPRGQKKRVYVHRLIAEAFIGDSELTVNHIDGDPLNNNPDNLEYLSDGDNVIHSILFNRKNKGAYKHSISSGKKWYSRIKFEGEDIYLGSFYTEKEAREAYLAAQSELFKDHIERYKGFGGHNVAR